MYMDEFCSNWTIDVFKSHIANNTFIPPLKQALLTCLLIAFIYSHGYLFTSALEAFGINDFIR